MQTEYDKQQIADVKKWFADVVIPRLEERVPHLVPEMSIAVGGSYARGYADGYSDFESAIILPEVLWREHARELESVLWHGLEYYAPVHHHEEFSPLSFERQLRGHAMEFLEGKTDLPWENVHVNTLYELQTDLVILDAHDRLKRLREGTSPLRFPERLWKKLLLWNIGHWGLGSGFLSEKPIQREKMAFAHIHLAQRLKAILQIGHILNRQYYPHFKRLSESFAVLPCLADQVVPHLHDAVSDPDWRVKDWSLSQIRDVYEGFIEANHVLTASEMSDPEGALRRMGWAHPEDIFGSWVPEDWVPKQVLDVNDGQH